MTTCLVTGGDGFLDARLVERLVALGHTVRVLDDLRTGRLENLRAVRDRIDFRLGGITDPDTVGAAVQDCTWVFHLAALPSVSRSVEDPLATHAVCATGSLRVLNAACRAGVGRVIYASSSSVYGDLPGSIRTEDDPPRPLSPYAVAKLAGEHYCQCFTRLYGLETVRLRFFNIFGPRQEPHGPYAGVVPRFIAALAEGRPPTIHGDGLQSRDFTYVANAVHALLSAAEAPGAVGKVYNIGSGGSTSVLELVGHLNILLGSDVPPRHDTPRSGDVRHSRADIARAWRDLGYEPSVFFVEGLRRTIEAYRVGKA